MERFTKDSRKLSKKPEYGFKGNTIRKGAKNELQQRRSLSYSRNDHTCYTCKGACIFSAFYDSRKSKKKYQGMFHPKYHRSIVEFLQESSLVPYEGETYKSAEEFFAEADEKNFKREQVEALGYDPDSLALLSRKQKAKAKKYKLCEEEAKSNEEVWIDIEYGAKELKNTLGLYKNYKRDYARLEKIWWSKKFLNINPHVIKRDKYTRMTKPNRLFIKGNRANGYYKFRRYTDYYDLNDRRKTKEKALEIALKGDIVLSQDNDLDPDLLLKALLGGC